MLDASREKLVEHQILIARLHFHGTQQHGMRSEQFHLIGHSLGAHASGNAGEKYQYLMNGTKVARITGLDPAQP